MPTAAWDALLQSYRGRTADDPVVDANGDDRIDQAEAFRFQPASTQCASWGSDHALFVFGGSWNTAPLTEAWLWDTSLRRLPVKSVPIGTVDEKGAGWLRIVTDEGCCDARWTRVTWLRRKGKDAEVALSFPLSAGDDVSGEVEWSGTPGPRGKVVVRYFVAGGREVQLKRSPAAPWSGGVLAEAFNGCAQDRLREMCEVAALHTWARTAPAGP